MRLDAPQIIWLALSALSLLIAAANDGEPKTGHHRFGLTLIGAACAFTLLWWGGFFEVKS